MYIGIEEENKSKIEAVFFIQVSNYRLGCYRKKFKKSILISEFSQVSDPSIKKCSTKRNEVYY